MPNADRGIRKPAVTSAGLILFRGRGAALEVFLVHPGGPFFAKKDEGAWSIPKGLIEEGEDPLAAAEREFREETGCSPDGMFLPLSPVTQRGGKTVLAWAIEGDCDAAAVRSNTFTLEWPPRSGRFSDFPEVDRAAWFTLSEAKHRINPAQTAFLDELAAMLSE